MQDNNIKRIVYKTLLNDLNITKKYSVYDNGTYIIADMITESNYAVILYCTSNKIYKHTLHNSEPYTYYAVCINLNIYIISRECIVNSYHSGEFKYTFADYIDITEEYLNTEGKAVRKLKALI